MMRRGGGLETLDKNALKAKAKRIRKLLQERRKKMKIIFAPKDKIEDLIPYVRVVLTIIGHPEAFVTNESMLYDFPVNASILKKFRKIGVKCSKGSYIYEIAQQLKALSKDSASLVP